MSEMENKMQILIYGRDDMPCGPSWHLEIDGEVIALTYDEESAILLAKHVIASTVLFNRPVPEIQELLDKVVVEDYTGHE